MIKKTITYTDYNGLERTESFHFNLSKAEVLDWETSISGGLSEFIKKVSNTQDGPALMELFKKLITKSYGEKSADGKRFMKIDPITGRPLYEAFTETEAFSQLYMELATNAEKAAEFVNGILPANMDNKSLPAATN